MTPTASAKPSPRVTKLLVLPLWCVVVECRDVEFRICFANRSGSPTLVEWAIVEGAESAAMAWWVMILGP